MKQNKYILVAVLLTASIAERQPARTAARTTEASEYFIFYYQDKLIQPARYGLREFVFRPPYQTHYLYSTGLAKGFQKACWAWINVTNSINKEGNLE